MANGYIPSDFLDFIKTQNPRVAGYYGNDMEGLYIYGKTKGYDEVYTGEASWNDVDEKIANEGYSYDSMGAGDRRDKRLRQDTSPSFMNSLAGMLDYGIDENS